MLGCGPNRSGFSPDTRSVLWQFPRQPHIALGVLTGFGPLAGSDSAPAVVHDVVYVGSDDHNLWP